MGQPYPLHVPIVLKSGSLNLLEPSGPVMGLLYLFTFIIIIIISHVTVLPRDLLSLVSIT